MSITYKVKQGDTLQSLSRRFYGVETNDYLISDANPSLTEPLTVGSEIIIPLNDDLIDTDRPTTDPDQVTVIINGKQFNGWFQISFKESVDEISSFTLLAPFEPENREFRQNFKPFAYNRVKLLVGGRTMFDGYMVNINTSVPPDSSVVSCSGYARCGLLNDCNPPPSTYPKIEFNNQDLRYILPNLCEPFGIGVTFDVPQDRFVPVEILTVTGETINQYIYDENSGVGPPFERVALEPNDNILAFMAKLAKERNLIISSAKNGNLLVSRIPSVKTPVARLQQGLSPLVDLQSDFNPQSYYSHITGIEKVRVGNTGSRFTVKNPRLNVLRPFVYNVDDAEKGSVKTAVNAKIGRMFGDMVSYSAVVSTWRTEKGELWKKGDTVIVNAPRCMIYNDYRFLIKEVEFLKTENEKTALLTLVLPQSYSGKIPEVLPWD